jgi:hypothetical protein
LEVRAAYEDTDLAVGPANRTAVVESAGTDMVKEFEFNEIWFSFSAFCVCDTKVSVPGSDDNCKVL